MNYKLFDYTECSTKMSAPYIWYSQPSNPLVALLWSAKH